MNIYSYIKTEIAKVCKINDDFAIETPKFENQGDVAINVALLLAKKMGKTPREIAESFIPVISKLPFVAKVEVAGAGFINLYLKQEFLYKAFGFSVEKNYRTC